MASFRHSRMQDSASAGQDAVIKHDSMRVAIVCGHFMPEVGYQEVWIARTLARLGARVRVVTSVAVSSSVRWLRRAPYPAGRSWVPEGYEIVRLPVAFRFRSAVLSRGVAEVVAEWSPELICLLGIGKVFGTRVLTEPALRDVPIVCFFSELDEYRRHHSLPARLVSWLQDRGLELFKESLYRRAIRRAQLLVCNSPGTLQWLHARCRTTEEREALTAKARVLTLGYDSRLFFFDATEREQTRQALGVAPGDVVLVTVTRVVPQKGLERIVDAVGALQHAGLPVWYLLIGGMGNAYERELRRRMQAQPRPERFQLLPFGQAEEVRQLLAGADLGIWMQIAISAHEAMGTGLPVLLPRRFSLSHLLTDGVTGWYWDEPEGFEEALAQAVGQLAQLSEQERVRQRRQLAQENARRFAYEAILHQIFQELGIPPWWR